MRRVAVIGFGVVLVVGLAWMIVGDFGFSSDVSRRAAPIGRPLDGTSGKQTTLPPLDHGKTATPLLPEMSGEDLQLAPPVALELLRISVVYALGQPAAGGRVVLFNDTGDLVGEGVLDGSGSWEHVGVDGPAELLVLGLSKDLARFLLPFGRGEHLLTLAGGAWLEGRVLVNGAAPGEPFPLALVGTSSTRRLLGTREGRPARPQLQGQISSQVRGGFFTDAAGRFLVSGLEQGAEITLKWPRIYELDESYPPPTRA